MSTGALWPIQGKVRKRKNILCLPQGDYEVVLEIK